MTRIIRPLKFDKPRQNERLRKRREADRKRRERERDTVQRRMYQMVEPSFDVLWEEHGNDNSPRPSRQQGK